MDCNAEVTGYPGEVRIPDSGTGLVDMNLDSIGDLTIADIDGDGAEDVVGTSFYDREITWWGKRDGCRG